jgi:transposase
MSRFRKRYSKEEKLQIVKLSMEEDCLVPQLADQYGIHVNTLYKWRNQYANFEHNAFPGKGNKLLTDEQREIESLKKQLREKELENEILKKAVGIFSSPNRKNLLS